MALKATDNMTVFGNNRRVFPRIARMPFLLKPSQFFFWADKRNKDLLIKRPLIALGKYKFYAKDRFLQEFTFFGRNLLKFIGLF